MFLEHSRDRILQEFDRFCQMLPEISEEIQRELFSLDEETALAMKYLYGNMPLSDVGNYPVSTFLDYARQGVFLREQAPWCKMIPEHIFLEYVLFHRVNEEEIKPCRQAFYRAFAGRIHGLEQKRAILKVNEWCAEEVTYQSTDERTSSAWDVWQKGYGRCGEESVFAVNALRSVGIPARQVYAPRWSHCDDNHAWVEAWCDGEWYYLGACEPEAVLNKGWFTNAASRAMMVHSRCFNSSNAGKNVIGREGIALMENQLSRYAKTRTITIRVRDLQGRPAAGAKILAEVMNYAEFAAIAKLTTGPDGSARLETGLGSLHIFASQEGIHGECILDTREAEECCCVLGVGKTEGVWTDFDMIAPVESIKEQIPVSREQEAENNRRVARAAELCRKKRKAFFPRWRKEFLPENPQKAERYMSVLSDKDRADAAPEVLKEHYEEALIYENQYPEDIFLSYVWNPRVADEVLTKWRRCILEYFCQEQQKRFREEPECIWSWIQEHLVSRPNRESLTVYTTPAAALKLGIARKSSRQVLFVAIARTLGIAARLNPMDGDPEYWKDGNFVSVGREEVKTAHLTIFGNRETGWAYHQNWSIARAEADGYHSLKLREAGLKQGYLELDMNPGEYRILTANRLPTGNIFASRYDFRLVPGASHEVCLEMREASLADMLDSHSIPDHDLTDGQGERHSIGALTKDGRRVLFWLEAGKEPTEHILNELMEMQEKFRQCQKQLLFILGSREDLSDATFSKCRKALPEAPVLYDTFGKELEMTARSMYVDPDKLPLMVVTDGAATGIFAASGYSVGMADMLWRILHS